MSFVAEFAVVSPILQDARAAVPEMEYDTEDFQVMRNGDQQFVFWADGDDFETFEAGLDADPTAADYCSLAEVGDRRLYRVTLTEAAIEYLTCPLATELDITFLDVTVNSEESRVRARIPNRAALSAYRDTCRERDLPFRLLGIHDEDDAGEHGYGVTPRQREVLLHALDAGYFRVPRQTTLVEMAAELDVSDQALSACIRRGQGNLVRNALGRDVATRVVDHPTRGSSPPCTRGSR